MSHAGQGHAAHWEECKHSWQLSGVNPHAFPAPEDARPRGSPAHRRERRETRLTVRPGVTGSDAGACDPLQAPPKKAAQCAGPDGESQLTSSTQEAPCSSRRGNAGGETTGRIQELPRQPRHWARKQGGRSMCRKTKGMCQRDRSANAPWARPRAGFWSDAPRGVLCATHRTRRAASKCRAGQTNHAARGRHQNAQGRHVPPLSAFSPTPLAAVPALAHRGLGWGGASPRQARYWVQAPRRRGLHCAMFKTTHDFSVFRLYTSCETGCASLVHARMPVHAGWAFGARTPFDRLSGAAIVRFRVAGIVLNIVSVEGALGIFPVGRQRRAQAAPPEQAKPSHPTHLAARTHHPPRLTGNMVLRTMDAIEML